MGCDRFAEVAAELSLGVLTGRERADALAHLERCDACRETVDRLTVTGEQLLGLLPAAEPRAGFETRVVSRLGIAVSGVPPPEPRTLATLAAALAGVAAGLGGWGLRGATTPAPQSPLSSAALLSAARQDVGALYYYNSGTQWLYMTVDMPSGNGLVTCELKGGNGQYTTVGKFRLARGYGAWGSPAQWSGGTPVGARLVAADGKVLATATFP
jgi:hypothetical protein